MTITLPEVAKFVVLTPAEYDALPVDPRLELVDGVLHFMTPATRRHQEIVDRLKQSMQSKCPPDLRVVREQELRIADDHRRNPDLMVISAAADSLDAYSFRPADVLLAIEVVSPGTETADRLHKPAEYATAGIAHYWRITTKPALTVFTYRLGEALTYLHTGEFGAGDMIAAPGLAWAKIPVDDLTV